MQRHIIFASVFILSCAYSILMASAEKYAVLVGISGYETIKPSLKFAEMDVDYLKPILEEYAHFAPKNIQVLKGKDAIKSKIESRIKKYDFVTQKDIFLFYFSGHGVLAVNSKKKSGFEHFLLPYEAEIGNKYTYISYDQLGRWIEQIPAKKKFVILDACYTGEGKSVSEEGAKSISLPPKPDPEEYLKKAVIAIMTASAPDKPAYEDTDKKHGVFTYYLGEALKQPELRITVSDIIKYVREQIHANQPLERRQEPTLIPPSCSEIFIDNTVGYAAITSNPIGAEVLLDGESIGRTPIEKIKLDATGVHRLELKLNDEYEPVTESIKISPRGVKTLHYDIKLKLGEVKGRVRDKTGQPVRNARVTLLGDRKEQGIYESFTDETGNYALYPAPGIYPGITAELSGYRLIGTQKSAPLPSPLLVGPGGDQGGVANSTIEIETISTLEIDLFMEGTPTRLYVKNVPKGASIKLDGEEKGRTPGLIDIEPGEHKLEVEHPDYEPYSDYIEIKRGQELFKDDIMLSPKPGSLLINTNPPDTRIYIAGSHYSAGDTIKNLSAGLHRIKVQKDGYNERELRVEIQPNRLKEMSIELFKESGMVLIESQPGGAKIFIDNIPLEETTPWNMKPSLGKHAIRLEKGGYEPKQKEILIEKGRANIVNETLIPKPGYLIVKTNLDGKQGYRLILAIDGISTDVWGKRKIAAGKHSVRVDAYKAGEKQAATPLLIGSSSQTVTITPEATRRLFLNLEESPPINMILIPQGYFTMGSDTGDGAPAHRVYLGDFYIDKFEATNGQYRQFLEYISKTGDHSKCHPDEPGGYNHIPLYWDSDKHKQDNPVHGVSWFDAYAYAHWLGKRLPTEAEWEKSTRGTDERRFPWGDIWDASKLAWKEPIEMVGSHPGGKSPYGVMDMAGNVWEWVSDWYSTSYYRQSPSRNPKGPKSGKSRVIRGYFDLLYRADASPCTARRTYKPDYKHQLFGFRCAKSK